MVLYEFVFLKGLIHRTKYTVKKTEFFYENQKGCFSFENKTEIPKAIIERVLVGEGDALHYFSTDKKYEYAAQEFAWYYDASRIPSSAKKVQEAVMKWKEYEAHYKTLLGEIEKGFENYESE